MKSIEKPLTALILGICAIVCVVIATNGFIANKKLNKNGITVTGSASKDFISDLIVWSGSFSETAYTQKDAYAQIKENADKIKIYLSEKNINPDDITFSAVSVRPNFRDERTVDSYTGETVYSSVFDGYTLSQNISISSYDVDKVEVVSRDITELIDDGVTLSSSSPEYYYTKLDELKIEMIEQATANAQLRAQKVAENSGGTLGELAEATLGVFQITATNSSAESYDYMGAFNTSSKNKTVQVTVKLNYRTGN